jgi:histidine triad (HIT) family protein
MEECIFCKIEKGEIPAKKIYESPGVFAVNDISPQAPVHILVIPRKHIQDTETVEDMAIMGDCFEAVQKITRDLGINQKGYRVITNTGKHGGQEVPHLHFHILGGKKLGPLV